MTSHVAQTINMSVSLQDLISGLVELEDYALTELAVPVTGIQIDSRKLVSGDLFIAYFGRNHDARDYISAALDHDVSAILAESGGNGRAIRILRGKPVIAVDNLTAKISEIAARFYGRPSETLSIFGITGTNGKTSCSQFMAQILRAVGQNCGVMGTLGYGPFDNLLATELTTPDAVFTQMALAEMSQRGLDPVAMEVSSVGLHQKRVAAVNFKTQFLPIFPVTILIIMSLWRVMQKIKGSSSRCPDCATPSSIWMTNMHFHSSMRFRIEFGFGRIVRATHLPQFMPSRSLWMETDSLPTL